MKKPKLTQIESEFMKGQNFKLTNDIIINERYCYEI